MAGEISTIQSLKAVDAWIDVINANINGGVRTAFKSSRLKFSGSNVDVQRAGNSTSLPLQFPESGLTTANTVIDFTQGAITASTENTHLAIQGEGFFLLVDPNSVNRTPGTTFGAMLAATASSRMYVTRDGEFHTDKDGLLVHSSGLVLVSYSGLPNPVTYNSGVPYFGGVAPYFGAGAGVRAVFNDLDLTPPTVGVANTLSTFLQVSTSATGPNYMRSLDGSSNSNGSPVITFANKQGLHYSQFGSTVFDFGFTPNLTGLSTYDISLQLSPVLASQATILSKSLEASNASMTQSVPELSLAQKLFSALTKVLQTKQTNVDGVLNLVR